MNVRHRGKSMNLGDLDELVQSCWTGPRHGQQLLDCIALEGGKFDGLAADRLEAPDGGIPFWAAG